MSFPPDHEQFNGHRCRVADAPEAGRALTGRLPADLASAPEADDAPTGADSRLEEARKAGFIALGLLMLLLGFVGAFLPVMPTTIFLILAAWFFSRSSPRLESWMLDHPRFGSVLRHWRLYGAIPRRAKFLACAGMAGGFAGFMLLAAPGPLLAAAVAAFMLAAAAYVVTRPAPPVSPVFEEMPPADRRPAGRGE